MTSKFVKNLIHKLAYSRQVSELPGWRLFVVDSSSDGTGNRLRESWLPSSVDSSGGSGSGIDGQSPRTTNDDYTQYYEQVRYLSGVEGFNPDIPQYLKKYRTVSVDQQNVDEAPYKPDYGYPTRRNLTSNLHGVERKSPERWNSESGSDERQFCCVDSLKGVTSWVHSLLGYPYFGPNDNDIVANELYVNQGPIPIPEARVINYNSGKVGEKQRFANSDGKKISILLEDFNDLRKKSKDTKGKRRRITVKYRGVLWEGPIFNLDNFPVIECYVAAGVKKRAPRNVVIEVMGVDNAISNFLVCVFCNCESYRYNGPYEKGKDLYNVNNDELYKGFGSGYGSTRNHKTGVCKHIYHALNGFVHYLDEIKLKIKEIVEDCAAGVKIRDRNKIHSNDDTGSSNEKLKSFKNKIINKLTDDNIEDRVLDFYCYFFGDNHLKQLITDETGAKKTANNHNYSIIDDILNEYLKTRGK